MKKQIKILLSLMLILSMLAGCTSPAPEVNVPENTVDPGKVVEESITVEGSARGYHGDIKVSVNIDKGEIIGVNVIEEDENPVLSKAAYEQLTELVVATNSTELDAVTGATFSSNGFLRAINDAIKSNDVQLASVKAYEPAKEEVEQEYDVVILGAGGAGMSAAIEAREAGATVVILEKAGMVGGNTLRSGSYNGSGTRFQEALNIPDTPDILYEDVMKGGDYKSVPELVRVFADNAGKTVEWTVDHLGVRFNEKFLSQFDVASHPRSHIPVQGNDIALIQALENKCIELGVEIKVNTEATKLLQDDSGKVNGAIGVTKDGQEIKFLADKGVIIATGGFARNFEMVGKYDPSKAKMFISTNAPTITGDGIIMAQEIGAELVGMEYVQTNPSGNPVTGDLMLFAGYGKLDGGFVVNKEGKRFVNDAARRDVQCAAYLEQTDGIVYYIWGNEVDSKRDSYNVNIKDFEIEKATGSLIKADTLKECADFFGVNYENLEETRKHYNEMVRNGEDTDFGRTSNLTVTETGPFYMAKITPSVHHTMGGIKINTDAQVINVDGEIIAGLFAAGEVTGGIHGANRLGGNAVTDAMVFGRIAGQNVVK